jgi:aminoglycoside phosphotransferase (APT) family kinase protein
MSDCLAQTMVERPGDSMAVDRLARLETMRAFVAERLLPAMGKSGPFALRAATAGGKSLVYFLDISQAASLVLRADRNRRHLRYRARCHDILSRRGFLCPSNVFVDLRQAARRRYGYCFLVERRVPGTSFAECDPLAVAPAVGHLFARLHSFTGLFGGKPGKWLRNPASISARLKARAARWLAEHRRLNLPGASAIESWLAALPSAAWRQRPRLCHHDINLHNLLVADGEIGLVDLAELSYNSAAYELGRLKVKLFSGNEPAWDLCRQTYLKSADPDLRTEIERTSQTGLALACLHFAVYTNNPDARRQRLNELATIMG